MKMVNKTINNKIIVYLLVFSFLLTLQNYSIFAKLKAKPNKLYDTHAHYDGDDSSKMFITQMRKNKVATSVLLNMDMEPGNPSSSYNDIKEALRPYPGSFKPFFGLEVKSPTEITRSKLDSVWSVNPKFKGMGEFALYRDPYKTSVLTDQPWPDLFQFAADKNIFLMIHLRIDQPLSQLETMLDAYPNAKVLLHGPEFPNELPSILQNHTNLYYTLDTATLLWFNGSSLMYPNSNTGRKVFLNKFDKNKKLIMKNALTNWKPVIAAAPNRVVWGTDASFDWHLKTDVYKRLIVFSRDFIKKLPKSQQKAFAYENALRAFGPGVKFK